MDKSHLCFINSNKIERSILGTLALTNVLQLLKPHIHAFILDLITLISFGVCHLRATVDLAS